MTARDATESIEQLLFSLEKLSPRLAGRENDVKFLRDMLQSHEFHSLMKVHQQVSAATSSSSPSEPSCCCPNPLTLAHTVSYDLETCSQPEAQELFDLLTSPHMDALISTHDRVANKEYPVQSVITVESGNEEGGGGGTLEQPVKIVRIEKGKDPLGATVKEEKNSIVVSRVLCGGAAEKSGLLHSGDIIHEINGKSMQGFSIVDVANLMAGLVGTVVFKITPAQDDVRPKRRNQVPLYVRPIFSYDPAKDRHSPCPEAGLRFERGEVLRVVNQEDPNWWQAVREGEKGITAGIIPSQKLRERLECYESYGQQREVAPPRRRRNNKTVVYDASSHVFGKEIVTYEAIVKIEPQVDRPRPLLLIAPRGEPFNVNRLKSKLLADESNLFGEPLLHTTRPALPNEARGSQQHRYSFISKHNMEREIANNNFVEHGRVEAHHYGVSINSIRDVINSGKICILTLLPQVIKRVRTAEVKPFIVYLRPPTAEYMRTHWLSQGLIRESGISDVLRQAVHIENTYSHYFDHTLIFKTPGHTHTELVGVARQLLQQRQWVPASWAV